MMRSQPIDLADALRDPTSAFSEPEDVLSCEGISQDMKIEILRRWEYDARELGVAEEEGMIGGPPSLLHRVQEALRSLDSGPEHPLPAPTKQGGV